MSLITPYYLFSDHVKHYFIRAANIASTQSINQALKMKVAEDCIRGLSQLLYHTITNENGA